MSDDLKVPGFKSSEIITGLANGFASSSEAEKKAQIKKNNGIFELQVSNDDKQTTKWTIDLKKTGTVYKGPAQPKADVTIILGDDTMLEVASGKLAPQKAFMTGKLKIKGNMMLATKLGDVLKSASAKAKL